MGQVGERLSGPIGIPAAASSPSVPHFCASVLFLLSSHLAQSEFVEIFSDPAARLIDFGTKSGFVYWFLRS